MTSPSTISPDSTIKTVDQEKAPSLEGHGDATHPGGESISGPVSGKDVQSPRDPINWFGILVLQALRAFQKDFQTAVTGNIPMMASHIKGNDGGRG